MEVHRNHQNIRNGLLLNDCLCATGALVWTLRYLLQPTVAYHAHRNPKRLTESQRKCNVHHSAGQSWGVCEQLRDHPLCPALQ